MAGRRGQLPEESFADFGTLLRVLRRGARLTQRDLGLAVGYSEAQISRLEQGKRLPDPAVVAALFIPSLGLSGEPAVAGRLHALARAARDARSEPEPGPAGDGGQRETSAPHPDDLAAIPAAPRPYVDRPAAAARLRERLAEVRRVLVCGPPGVGKTTLAAAVARELADGVPVCWLTLTEGITTRVEAVVRQLARFLDRHGRTGVAPLLDPGQAERPLPADEQLHLLATALNRDAALICLDNAQLLGGERPARAVIEHLAVSSRASFLVISREDFQLSGFEPARLGGLDHGEARTLIERVGGRGVLPGRARAARPARRALHLADQLGAVTAVDAAGIRCRALGVLGVVARLRGQPEEAQRVLRLSLAAARAAQRRDMVGRALFNLAATAHERGELDRAERLYAEALAEMRPIGDGFGAARVLHSLAAINFHRCAADEAMALFLESVALRRRLGDTQGAANSEHSYALVLLSLGRTAEARELLEAALRDTGSLGERRSRGHYLDSLAMIALVDGDIATAERYLGEADDIAAAIGEPLLRAAVDLHRALACLARGDLAAARWMAGLPEHPPAPAADGPAPARLALASSPPAGPPLASPAPTGPPPAGPAPASRAQAGEALASQARGGSAPEPDSSPMALERCAVVACVTLASGDRATAARQAADMERRALASGCTLEAQAARRIAAAAAASGEGPAARTVAARYPRLIWVSDPVAGLELSVGDASLAQS